MQPPTVTISRILRALAPLALLLLAAPSAAPAAGWTNGTASTCSAGYNSGGRDQAGRLYMPCTATTIRIVEPNGSFSDVAIDAGVARIAPSPDGRYLYAVDATSVKRFTRAANGSYKVGAFTIQQPAGWAAKGWRVCGWGIATDGYGNIYVSNGGWCPGNPNQIVKLDAAGRVKAVFGDWGIASKWVANAAGQMVLEWNHKGSVPGQFQSNMMLAVTADGSRVWVADELNQRVQYFDRRPDHAYAYAGMWSGEGTAWDGQLGAVYGVALDPWGYAYVAQTTTKQVWRLDPDGRNPVLVHSKAGTTAARDHTLAVDARGSVWVGEWRTRLDRTAQNLVPGPYPPLAPEPAADLAPPVLTSVTGPIETFDATVDLAIDATDDAGVRELRIADDSGEWQAWRPYSARLRVTLTGGYGARVTYVQVRDAMGRESDVRWAVVRLRPVPDTLAPTLAVSGPATAVPGTAALTVDARDAVGVTHLRIAAGDGDFGPWTAWSSADRTLRTTLQDGVDQWIRYVQVRDAAWNVSDTATVTIARARPTLAPIPNPTPVAVAGGGGDPAAAQPDVVRDRVAPRIVRLVAPRRSCSRRIVLRVGARDSGRIVAMRVANENGRYGRWRSYRGRTVHFLSRGRSYKRITVQVRDSAGNVSRPVSRKTRVVACSRRG